MGKKKILMAIVQPLLRELTAALAEMRDGGATQSEIDGMLTAMEGFARKMYPTEDLGPLFAEMRKRARPQHDAPGRLQ
jgi:hypothetical protein